MTLCPPRGHAAGRGSDGRLVHPSPGTGGFKGRETSWAERGRNRAGWSRQWLPQLELVRFPDVTLKAVCF